MVNTIHMYYVLRMVSLCTTNLPTECINLSFFYSALHLFVLKKNSFLFLLHFWMLKMISLSSTNQCVHEKSTRIQIVSMKSYNIKQFHKINFHFEERIVLQMWSKPIEFLCTSLPKLVNSCNFFHTNEMRDQILLNQHHDGYIFTWRFRWHKKWEQWIRSTERWSEHIFLCCSRYYCCKLKYILYKILHSTFGWRSHLMWSIWWLAVSTCKCVYVYCVLVCGVP